MSRRRPADTNTAIVEGVDHLLRRFQGLPLDLQTPPPALTPPVDTTGRKVDRTLTVAAYNAHPSVRAAADYVCNGTNDDVEIAAAAAELGNDGGIISLSAGDFFINTGAGDVTITLGFSTELVGTGFGTTIWFSAYGGIPNFRMLTGARCRDFSVEQEYCEC